jgi:hypothetical protein
VTDDFGPKFEAYRRDMAGRIEAWRRQQEAKARARAKRFKDLDGQLREVVEKREIPRPAKPALPEPGTLPPDVAALVDDGQVRRATTLLANLTGASAEEAREAVAAYVRRSPP